MTAEHAFVRDGVVVVKADGLWIANTMTAWGEWLMASDSPLPSTRRRAAEIRAALDEVRYLKAAA